MHWSDRKWNYLRKRNICGMWPQQSQQKRELMMTGLEEGYTHLYAHVKGGHSSSHCLCVTCNFLLLSLQRLWYWETVCFKIWCKLCCIISDHIRFWCRPENCACGFKRHKLRASICMIFGANQSPYLLLQYFLNLKK